MPNIITYKTSFGRKKSNKIKNMKAKLPMKKKMSKVSSKAKGSKMAGNSLKKGKRKMGY